MNNLNQLIDEEIITTSQGGDGIATLTNYRVHYSTKKWGKAYTASILLKNISSIEINYKSNVILLILAGFILLTSIASNELIILGVILFSVFVLFFFLSRRHYIIISSNGGAKINLLVKGAKKVNVLGFLNQIEQAILKIK